MTLPASMPTLPVLARRPLPAPRALLPSGVRKNLRVFVRRALPALRSSLAVAVAGVAAEYALRVLVRYAASARAVERSTAAVTNSLPVVPTRVVITEVIIRERVRRIR